MTMPSYWQCHKADGMTDMTDSGSDPDSGRSIFSVRLLPANGAKLKAVTAAGYLNLLKFNSLVAGKLNCSTVRGLSCA